MSTTKLLIEINKILTRIDQKLEGAQEDFMNITPTKLTNLKYFL